MDPFARTIAAATKARQYVIENADETKDSWTGIPGRTEHRDSRRSDRRGCRCENGDGRVARAPTRAWLGNRPHECGRAVWSTALAERYRSAAGEERGRILHSVHGSGGRYAS